MSESSSGKLSKTLGILRDRYGEISWWPGDRDEVMIGAILTQQTRWENVIRALAKLRVRGLCSVAALGSADLQDIEKPYGARVFSGSRQNGYSPLQSMSWTRTGVLRRW
jgi:endonuclease III-like uncharacterized protein